MADYTYNHAWLFLRAFLLRGSARAPPSPERRKRNWGATPRIPQTPFGQLGFVVDIGASLRFGKHAIGIV